MLFSFSGVISSIKQGHEVVMENEAFRCAKWHESLVRYFKRDALADKDIAINLIHYIGQQKDPKKLKEGLDAASKFINTCKSTHSVFKRLENTIFAHKCQQTIGIPIPKLIDEKGGSVNDILTFLKKNHLHYVIKKANDSNKETAFLVTNGEVYIRSASGKSFLDTPEHIDLVLEALPTNHPDRSLLTTLKHHLENSTNEDLQSKILELQNELKLSHYSYISLKDVKVDNKGVMISQSYLSQGIEEHDVSKWKEAKATSLELSEKPVFKLRIITRLPEYALTKTWTSFFASLLRNVFNFRAHGHSWIELIEPIHEDTKFSFNQKVTDVGYYFHPFDKYKRFQNADPMSYMPIPKEQLVVEEIEITKEQFDKGQCYLNKVQGLILEPKKPLEAVANDPTMQSDDVARIKHLYKTTIKSTCLAFANAFKESITGIEQDDRGSFRKFFFPKKSYKALDRLDTLFNRTYLLDILVKPVQFLHRMPETHMGYTLTQPHRLHILT